MCGIFSLFSEAVGNTTFGLVQHQFHVTSELCYLLGAAGSSLCLFCLGTGSNYMHMVK